MAVAEATELMHDGTGFVEYAEPRRAKDATHVAYSSATKLAMVVLVVILIAGAFGGLLYTQPWSKITVTVDNLSALPAQVTVYIDENMVGNGTVDPFTEGWSASFEVVFGAHVVVLHYEFVAPQAHELTRPLHAGPLSSAEAYFVLTG